MKDCALPYSVTTLACVLADSIPDKAKLGILAAALTQLADTLALIAQTRISSDAPQDGDGC